MRLSSSRLTAIAQRNPQDFPLWDLAGARPSLDLRFAESKSLVDATTGSNLVTFTRASSGTYVGSDGLIKTAVTNLLVQSEDFLTTWTVHDGLTRTANQIASPNGSITADLLAGNGVSTGYAEQPVASSNQFVSGTTYTFSVYLKKANTSTCLTLLFGSTFNSGGSNPVATWNLDTGVPSFSNGATGSMTPVGNGWYRCVVTNTATQTETKNQQWLRMASASGDVYAWGAQLEQSSTAGEYIPTTSVINSAPRFDHNPTTGESLGLLVEESRTNLLLQSNQFGTTWTNTNSSETSASGTAPDGTNTAWELKDTVDGSSVAHNLLQTVSFTSGVTYTISCWFKKGTLSGAGLGFPSSAFTSTTVSRFNLDTGTVASAGSGTTNTITAFPNGWYRCSMSLAATATTTGSVQVRISTTDSNNYQGDGTGTVLIWGAQLEAGAFPTSYIPTTTATVTRAADVASISNENLLRWFTPSLTNHTFYAEARRNAVMPNGTVMEGFDGANLKGLTFGLEGSGANPRILIRHGASRVDSNTVFTSKPIGTLVKYAAVTSSASAACVDTVLTTAGSGTSQVDWTATSGLSIGSRIQGASIFFNGTIARICYWPTPLANSTLQTITQ